MSPTSTVQLQEEVKGQSPFVFSVMAKGHSPEIRASWGGEPSMVFGTAVMLKEVAWCLPFWGHCNGENLEKVWKILKLLGS